VRNYIMGAHARGIINVFEHRSKRTCNDFQAFWKCCPDAVKNEVERRRAVSKASAANATGGVVAGVAAADGAASAESTRDGLAPGSTGDTAAVADSADGEDDGDGKKKKRGSKKKKKAAKGKEKAQDTPGDADADADDDMPDSFGIGLYNVVARELWKAMKTSKTPEDKLVVERVEFFWKNGHFPEETRPRRALPSPADYQRYAYVLWTRPRSYLRCYCREIDLIRRTLTLFVAGFKRKTGLEITCVFGGPIPAADGANGCYL
jgi:hypothetical protein